MVNTQRALKLAHTLAAAGLVGGLLAYAVILMVMPADAPRAYAEMRASIAAISNWILLPSLAVALVSGIFSMMVVTTFIHRGWAWLKAALGILMFKAVLTTIGAHAEYVAGVTALMADGEAAPRVLDTVLRQEWYTLWAIVAITVANYYLAIWRPRFSKRKATAQAPARPATPTVVEAPSKAA